ncbi:hypothetical protein ACFYKX_10960 [Cytobacillus sp. FJAT-54145]|uniref:Uncharacterized protein n=1 Tax=Cytobacillus spartinae TaxID=3299023 RepID=A0ABW6KA70_9BACI
MSELKPFVIRYRMNQALDQLALLEQEWLGLDWIEAETELPLPVIWKYLIQQQQEGILQFSCFHICRKEEKTCHTFKEYPFVQLPQGIGFNTSEDFGAVKTCPNCGSEVPVDPAHLWLLFRFTEEYKQLVKEAEAKKGNGRMFPKSVQQNSDRLNLHG